MSLIVRTFALILRIAMYYSPIAKKFSEILIFNQMPYSLDNIKECRFLRNNFKMLDSEIYFNVWYYFKFVKIMYY